MYWFGLVIFILVILKWATQLWLEWLNERNVRLHSSGVPESLKDVIDAPTYTRSVEYTLAKSRLRKWELSYDTLVLAMALFSGILPRCFSFFCQHIGRSTWAMGGFLFLMGLAFSALTLPFDWYAQFRLEARFGFNTTTPKLWWADRFKGLCLGVVLGYPFLVLMVFLIQRAGQNWWLWAWGALMIFELVIAVLAPVLILPLFNKFTPLPEGPLRARLLNLAQRTGFRAHGIQVMDGSKRSRHSNAFFTGFGKFRKIVLFDTLIQQLLESELEAVLAHEIGHFKRKHIPKMLTASALGSLLGFYILSWLARQDWFYRGFGFVPDNVAAGLLLFGLLSGVATFWLSPLIHAWSRRYEYQADRFAALSMADSRPLIGALRKLNLKNLSNLTPHPFYSGFYYSHPTLLEREQALMALPQSFCSPASPPGNPLSAG
ncbi:MAG TPA: M48 family metallopeptidase [Verrucomicrobiae bacterium]|nr:M48 family metallopeptidase [Verrucomicrobiae bacterium]